MEFLFEIAKGVSLDEDKDFLATVADIVGSGDSTLFDERDWIFLESTKGLLFFRGMRLLCSLIPMLDVERKDLMRLVSTLVRLAGADLAANEPYRAFRKWCAGDPERVRAVLDDARVGDVLAIDHLGPVLEAGGSSADALSFVKDGPGHKAQAAAATALSRMTLDFETSTGVVRLLSQVAIDTQDEFLRIQALLSTFKVLENHSGLPREHAKRALERVISETNKESLCAFSFLLWHHGEKLDSDEVRWTLEALKSVSSDHTNTLEQIDHAVSALLRAGYFEPLSCLISELIRRSRGKIQLATFPTFQQELVGGNTRRLSKLAIDWFLEGDPYVCGNLALALCDSSGPAKIFEPCSKDIPENSEDQLFVCRKCVGYLFHSPLTAVSLLIAMIRHGGQDISKEICDLIYNPILISYQGELRRYLDNIVESESETIAALITEVIDRKQRILEDIGGIESLVEMHPTESQRQIERVRWNRQMARSMEEGMKTSVLLGLVSKQYLLYGTSSSSYIESPGGDTRRIDMELGSHSFSFELPSLEVLDPEWLKNILYRFRFEQRIG